MEQSHLRIIKSNCWIGSVRKQLHSKEAGLEICGFFCLFCLKREPVFFTVKEEVREIIVHAGSEQVQCEGKGE